MSAPAFTHLGKEVLYRGQHYADACDSHAAEAIARGLNVIQILKETWAANAAGVA